jgi:hypothetical protein
LKQLFDVQFHLARHAKIMSWWEVEHLPMPELELIIGKLNEEAEKEERRQKGGDNLRQMAESFKLQRQLKERGLVPEAAMDPVQKKRLEKMKAIRQRHPIADRNT